MTKPVAAPDSDRPDSHRPDSDRERPDNIEV